MTVFFDIIVCLILTAFGYVFVRNYLNDKKSLKIERDMLKITRSTVLYFGFAVIAFGITITVFQLVYSISLIGQLKLLVLIASLIPTAAADFRTHKIPNQIILAAVALRLVLFGVEFIESVDKGLATLKDCLLGALIIGGFFLLLFFLLKNSIGMGDVKLFAVMGLYQGLWGAVNAVFFSLVVSFFVSIILLISKKKKRKDTIAFGPCILAGTVIAVNLAGM